MLLARRNQNWLPDVFNTLFDTDIMPKFNATAPAINVIEKENEYDVELAAPGMTKDDFKVTLDEEDNLVVALEKKEETTDEEDDKTSSDSLTKKDREKAQEDYLTTLTKGVANLFHSDSEAN